MPKPRLATIAHTFKNHFDLFSKHFSLAIGGVILAGATVITGVAGPAIASSAQHSSVHAVHPEAAPLTYGVDVSRYESDYDWNASPAKFGIIKATEGTSFRDASFARHWREMDKKGIVRGAYHYGHPSNDPIAEAEHFLSMVNSQPAKPGDLLVLDLETTDGESVAEVNAWAKAWLSHVKAKTGVTPMLYSGWNFANTYGKGLAEYPLWVAHYSKAKGTVTPPADWKSWAIHQYTDSPVDQNVSVLTPDQLRELGRPAV
ncbi:glycoside hydrolase family 25 protein [Nonomuraea sp. SYSU D8015]|uniref:glycoside hydrolase family 25 protein n=1 Tax=Nonomuraea sp. SYSU D8015 TaxID=2593644 RepID=UPI001660B2B8|nr:GH25 family lysozyme [Nonomuraea sp. SYSU D8015]